MTAADENGAAENPQWQHALARLQAGQPVVWCESPQLAAAAATPVQGELRFTGWTVSPAGVESVTIEVEGHGGFTADIGGRRPDVHKAFFPAEWARRPGFELTIPTAAWLPGVYDAGRCHRRCCPRSLWGWGEGLTSRLSSSRGSCSRLSM